jgi:hypothetical protein
MDIRLDGKVALITGGSMGMAWHWQRSSLLKAPRSRSLHAAPSLLPRPQRQSSRLADAAVPMRATSVVPMRSAGYSRRLPRTWAASISW